ncbi:MAG: polysaccharide export protein, partial [Candidatus Omnitrophica bacterium]|nr:polysaccharide export protein [Candidatus Omnitrophota bacterium]
AQNFANLVPEEDPQVEEELEEIDEEIEAILSNEGISYDIGDPSGSVVDDGPSNYTLGVNDVIEINVMRHPEVTGQYAINQEGKIQYEFIGDINIIGKTKNEVKEVLTEELAKFIISPEVTVKIVGYNSKIVYVIGEVGRPGKIFMRGDTITVREALVQAGLPLLSAKTTKSLVITPSESGKANQKKVNVHKLLYEGDLRENFVMLPGDTLYIPPTALAKTMRILQPIAAPISTAAGTGRTVTTGF